MVKVLPRKVLDATVMETSLRRINELYDRFDKVCVSFSGGKDSTVCLQLTLLVAKARKRLPLDVYTFDEEAIHPETVDYLTRVSKWPELNFRWYCVPIQHRNACSKSEPYWHPWAPEKRELWVRPLPPGAITELKGFERGMDMPSCAPLVYADFPGSVAEVRGIRAQESMRRLRMVSSKEADNWLTEMRPGTNLVSTSPIYDWSVEDVWQAPKQFGWDYNRAYDVMDKAGTSKSQQRVCPPYGEEPLNGLHQYAECWPQLWHKMVSRVPGAATAARYAKTELYGYGKLELPPGKTWRSWMDDQLEQWPVDVRSKISASIASAIRTHNRKTLGREIPDETPDPVSGISWAFLCQVAIRGDMKGRKLGGMIDQANKTLRKQGRTLAEALGEVK